MRLAFRCLRRLCACLLLAVLPGSMPASPVLADAVTDREAAIQTLTEQADAMEAFAAEIHAALQNPTAYPFLYDSILGPSMVVLERATVDKFVGYLQVENLLHPGTLDAARINKAAAALGIPGDLVKVILGDDQAVLWQQGSAGAHERLQKLAGEVRPKLETYVLELLAEVKAVDESIDQIAGASTWPPPKASGNVFSPVQVGGVTMDYCLSFATTCGQAAADEFCRRQSFTRAASFDWSYTRPTRTLGSGETCDQEGCGGFTRITCE